ncbi:PadR family transcriptional regulator [Thermanaerosceptrum fracticalcis]|uniref:PadR family transcriptional regulator n=2 Tax=Thermanaerosceptrum fracticalcis TaxID=1712410 RepID=A0A7G6DYR7_THEFR|nr:PadR family transcriptional regulator [Thermanaerosceptrum fracticalcis]
MCREHDKNCNHDSCGCRGGRIEKFMVPCLLLLLLKKEPTHGYDLMEDLAVFGLDNDPGAVYRTLRRLESDELVSSAWDTEGGGAAKRLYRITPGGREFLFTWVKTIRRTRNILDKFLLMYEELAGEEGAQ